MGIGGVSLGSLLIIFLIVLVLFGAKRLRNIGEELGKGINSFRKGMRDEDETKTDE